MPERIGFFVLVALFAAERLVELGLTRRNLGARRREAGAAGRGNFAWMVSLHVALLVLPPIEVLLRDTAAAPAVFWSCAAVLILAQALRWWSIASLGRAWNVRAVVDPELGFVQRGPYRWIRHPNYLAVVLEFLALPAAGGAWISWIALNALHAPVLRRRIEAEERELRAVPGYAHAMGAKGGLWPRRAP